ncbi:hypothetical protein [Arthrobacter sp. HLT1-20]
MTESTSTTFDLQPVKFVNNIRQDGLACGRCQGFVELEHFSVMIRMVTELSLIEDMEGGS